MRNTETKMQQKTKLTLIGEVIKTQNHKTIGVLVERSVMHPIYRKLIKSKKCYQVHDERGEAKLHDRVRIVECRPLSKTKHFRLKNVLSSGGLAQNKEKNSETKLLEERQQWIQDYGIQYAYLFKELLNREREKRFKARLNKTQKEESQESPKKPKQELKFKKSPKEEVSEAAVKNQSLENLSTQEKREEEN